METISVLVAGDFCPINRVGRLLESGRLSEVFPKGVGIPHSEFDYSIINFECPVVNNDSIQPIIKAGPSLKCSPAGLSAVKKVGFDCVTLANNHFRDYGDEGVFDTLDACSKLSLDYVGGGSNLSEASKVLYKDIKGKTLAIINCCEHEFSIATETKTGSNPLNPIKQFYAIQDARQKADIVLVIVHGGHEHFQLPSFRMIEAYRFFVDAGADAVINHHQHCYSGYELYKGKPIFYGLGNFCFDMPNNQGEKWNYGYMVKLVFSDTIEFKLIPYKQCGDNPCVDYDIDQNKFLGELDELNSIISDVKKLEVRITDYYSTSANSIKYSFEPLTGTVFEKLQRRGILPSFLTDKNYVKLFNSISCESHRDKILFFLTNSLEL